MKSGTHVIYYPKVLRDQFGDDNVLWTKNSLLGVVDTVTRSGDIVVRYNVDSFGVGAGLTETVPEMYVREAREFFWYEFWKRKGFNKNLWGYGIAVVFFLLFIK